ncbi:MAG: transposase, partial [Prevotellaceae bacterium]|nr:transposase [Prevotellaceae bacterium]
LGYFAFPQPKVPCTKVHITSDSRRSATEGWMKRLRIVDSTTITLFSNVIFKGETSHPARIITYVDIKKGRQPKLTSLLTNDFDMPSRDIALIYRRRWLIESLFKQVKQNFPLRYFYGESANAIKIQIWVTLIANLLLTVLQRGLQRSWSFSGLATMIRIVLMYYINLNTFFEKPDEDLKQMLAENAESPPMETLL